MNDDEVLKAHFPEAAALLRTLRIQDAELDGMCRDYLDLLEELSCPGKGLPPRYLADLAESVAGLCGDILAHLHAEQTRTRHR